MMNRSLSRHDSLTTVELHEGLQSDSDSDSADYVRWQSSQTTCSALNQLINSSSDEPHEGKLTPKGWQRQSSFDQIPGFSLLSTRDTDDCASPSQAPSSSSSSKSLRPSLTRPRSSNAGPRPSLVPNIISDESTMPLLGKAHPSAFFDMLKDVSAHLDKSVEVNSGKTSGSAYTTRPTKRPRHSSLESSPELRVGQVKRGRVSTQHVMEGSASRVLGKGKARDPLISKRDATEELHIHGEFTSGLACDAGNGSRNTDFGYPKTSSQTRMPPPALPSKHPGPVELSHNQPFIESPILSFSKSSHKTRNQATSVEPKQSKHESAPKYHPLLLEQQAKRTSSNLSVQSLGSYDTKPTQISASAKITSTQKSAPPRRTDSRLPSDGVLSSAHKPCSSQSTRPPVLGMRRTNGIMPSNIPAGGALPMKQKGFRPPLLPSSQVPQSSSQAAEPFSQSTGSTSSSASASSLSLSSRSPGSSSTSVSNASPLSQSPASRKGKDKSCSTDNVDQNGRKKVSSPTTTLPEPLDGDPDSSFGDMIPFDLDALEETMRLYD